MSLAKETWRVGCKTLQGAAHVVARTATAGVVVAGKVVKCACQGSAFVLEQVGADRFSEAIDGVGDTVDHGTQTVSDAVTMAADVVVGIPLAAASFAVGADDVPDELGEVIGGAYSSMCDNAEATCSFASSAKDQFVGKTQFDKAKQEYLALITENTVVIKDIQQIRNDLNKKINDRLNEINGYKNKSKVLFERFVVLSRKIADWRVKHYETPDVFLSEDVRETPLKTAKEIFADIDFDNDPIWSHLKGVFTAGLLTVAQVDDVVNKIQFYKEAAKATWGQDREINSKYRKLLDALDFVRESFALFVPLYAELQDQLEYAISSVGQIMSQRDMYYFADANVSVNPYYLPKHHLNILMACDKLTRILCEMSKRHYVTLVNNVPEVIEEDRIKVESLKRDEYAEVESLVAA